MSFVVQQEALRNKLVWLQVQRHHLPTHVASVCQYHYQLLFRTLHSVCHAELLEFLARHSRFPTYKLPSNIWLHGAPLETFSWLPWCNPDHVTYRLFGVTENRMQFLVHFFSGKEDLWPTIDMRMSWSS
jgi:hypothetical protein